MYNNMCIQRYVSMSICLQLRRITIVHVRAVNVLMQLQYGGMSKVKVDMPSVHALNNMVLTKRMRQHGFLYERAQWSNYLSYETVKAIYRINIQGVVVQLGNNYKSLLNLLLMSVRFWLPLTQHHPLYSKPPDPRERCGLQP